MMRAPRPAPTDVGGRRGALVKTLLAVAAIAVLIAAHVAAACCPETAPGSHHPAVALATAADAPAQATSPGCATSSTWTAPAVLGTADPSHAPLPAVLYVLLAALTVVPVATGFLRPGGSRAPPSHSRRLATLCVLRT